MRPRWMFAQLIRKNASALLTRASANVIVVKKRDMFAVASEACLQYAAMKMQ